MQERLIYVVLIYGSRLYAALFYGLLTFGRLLSSPFRKYRTSIWVDGGGTADGYCAARRHHHQLPAALPPHERLVVNPMRLVGFDAETLVPVGFVVGEVPLPPAHL